MALILALTFYHLLGSRLKHLPYLVGVFVYKKIPPKLIDGSLELSM